MVTVALQHPPLFEIYSWHAGWVVMEEKELVTALASMRLISKARILVRLAGFPRVLSM